MIRRILRDNTGSAFMMAIFVLALLTVLGTAIMAMTKQAGKVSVNYSDSMQAQYAAEAGVQDALVNLKDYEIRKDHDTWDLPTTGTDVSSDADYTVTYRYGWKKGTYTSGTRTETAYLVTSIGEVWADAAKTKLVATREVEATVVARSLPAVGIGKNVTWNGMFDGEDAGATVAFRSLTEDQIHGQNGYINKNYRNCDFLHQDFPMPKYPYENVKFTDVKNDKVHPPTKLVPSGNLLDGGGSLVVLDKDYYYHDGPLTIKAPGIKVADGKSPVIYVHGDVLNDGNVSIHGNLTIVVLTDDAYDPKKTSYPSITLNGNGFFNTDPTESKNTIKLYSPGQITVNPPCGGNLEIWGRTKVLQNGEASLNAKLYSDNDIVIQARVKGTVYSNGDLTVNGSGHLDLGSDTDESEKIMTVVKWAPK